MKKEKIKIVEEKGGDCERKWEVEEAMNTLKRYADLVKNKKLKDEAIAKLEEEANKYNEVAKELK